MPRKTLDSAHFLGDESDSGSDFQSPEPDGEQTDYYLQRSRYDDSQPSTSRRTRQSHRISTTPRTTQSGGQGIQAQPTTAVASQARGAGRRKKAKPVRRQVQALKEIRKLQKSTDYLIPRLPFSRLVREVLLDLRSEVTRMTKMALQALQESTEVYVTYQLQDAYTLTLHRGRVTLSVKDMELLRYLRGP